LPELDAIKERIDGIGEGTSVEPVGIMENMYIIPTAGYVGQIDFGTYLSTEQVHKIIKEGTKLYSDEY
jgi:hypothetical protein